jgi:hypothetical protein
MPCANMIRVAPVKEHTDAPIDGFKYQSAADFHKIHSLTITTTPPWSQAETL